MRTSTLAAVVTISPEIMCRELDGEVVILNLETGTYFGLAGVGARAWKLIQDHGALQQVLVQLQAEYRVTASVLERDLLELVDQMSTKGLVRVAPTPT